MNDMPRPDIAPDDPHLYAKLCGFLLSDLTWIRTHGKTALEFYAGDAAKLAETIAELVATAETCLSVDRELHL
jgi:hypothetical protein